MHTFLVIPKVDVVGTYASEKGSGVAKRTGFVHVAHKSWKSVCNSSGVGGRVLATLCSGFGSSMQRKDEKYSHLISSSNLLPRKSRHLLAACTRQP